MTTCMLALVRLLAGFVCLLIAKHRHVKRAALRKLLAAVFGPVAMPWVLVAGPDAFSQR